MAAKNKTNIIVWILCFLTSVLYGHVLAVEKKEEKIYTQTEFDKKLEEKLQNMIGKIKKKSIEQLAAEILMKERELEKKEISFAEREEQMKKAEQTLSLKVSEFEVQQRKFLGCVNENERKQLIRVEQLVKVISNMKPQKAADLLSVQEAAISVRILERIKPDRASKIFNMMDKEVSARLQKQYLDMKQ